MVGFEAPQSELEFLRQRLQEEQEKSDKANRARLEADTRCHLAEKERDIYKQLALGWRGRDRAAGHQQLGEESDMEQVGEDATAILLGGRGHLSFASLRNLFRRFRDHTSPFEESDEEEVDDEFLDTSNTDRMEEDHDMIEEDGDESSVSMNSDNDSGRRSQVSENAYHISDGMVNGRQVRAVSIAEVDI